MDELIKKMWYLYTHTHNGVLSIHKKKQILPFVSTWMDLVNKVGEKHILYDHTYMWSLKKIELIDSETD